MSTISDEFIKKLLEKYKNTTGSVKEEYDEFMKKKETATNERIKELRKKYPNIPSSLIDLLKFTNGTDGNRLYLFNSDIEGGEYPYYLVNSKEMLETDNFYYGDFGELDDTVKDERISKDYEKNQWMLFSNCMNNGGTSSLWIDFTPSNKGKVGQIIRFIHDEDEFIVIADSFDDYLKQVMDGNFIFIDRMMELSNITLSKREEKRIKKRKKKSEKQLYIEKILNKVFLIIFLIFGSSLWAYVIITNPLEVLIYTIVIISIILILSFIANKNI